MKALPSNARNQEGKCPACHAPLTQCEGRRTKKVQCPKCREIVILDPGEPAEAPSTSMEMLITRELAEIKSRLAQLGPLQNRVAKIERELAVWKASVATASSPNLALAAPEAPVAEPMAPALPLTPAEVEASAALPDLAWWRLRFGITPETDAQLAPFLETARGSRISIVVTRSDPVAREVGEYFQDRFSDAGWTGLDLRAEALSSPVQGLALTLGTGPISAAAAAIHRALAAAHIALAFRIDPAVSGPGITLIVGAPPPPPAEEKPEGEERMGI